MGAYRFDGVAAELEAQRRIVRKPALHFAVNGDTIVVVDQDQLAELKRAGERCDFVRNTFHHAAVAKENIRVMIDDLVARPIECRSERAFRKRHAHRVREPLAERARRRFDPSSNRTAENS